MSAPAPAMMFDHAVDLGGETWSTPAIVQFKDGAIVVTADRSGAVHGFSSPDLTPLWRIETGAEITASPLIFEDPMDGPLIVIGDHTGTVRFIDPRDGAILRSVEIGSAVRATAAAADIDGDGQAEIVLGIYGPGIVALRRDGSEVWRRRLPGHLFAGRMKQGVVSSALVCDVDRDGELEIVIGVRSSRLFCLEARTGRVKWFACLGYDPDSSPSFSLRGDGTPLVLFGGGEHTGGLGDNAVIALDGRDGHRVWTTDVGGGVDSSPMLLDRPGRSPLLFACSLAYPSVLALDAWSGALIWRHDFGPTPACIHGTDHHCRPADGRPYFTENAICRSYTTPLLADLDGDGRVEVVAGSNNGTIVVLDAETGTVRQTEATAGMARGSAVLGDIDGRGKNAVVAPSGRTLRMYRTRHSGPGTPMFKSRADHLGTVTDPPAVNDARPRKPGPLAPLAMAWRFGVLDAVRHVVLKIDEKILRRLGLRLFRYGY
ncbi:PQQ-binding-like beta-propeller repeat protein [Brevundimonas sp.]|uniref:outer membrane protein assembly factor BamB family protein n=1 Tax=Brevundimonas sp. TaxID=1871086 RepID=UPI002ABAD9E4|nr:PQQ-binding-like beta-propeller repeat protein [Brevundimonas sp.]MDZ4363994.1 PQQ-binding-like beta-propeller repeat protein [Brevundimonas sp.]